MEEKRSLTDLTVGGIGALAAAIDAGHTLAGSIDVATDRAGALVVDKHEVSFAGSAHR